MLDKKIGLIVEGGGMRGAYTGGVLEAFSDKKVYFPYIVAVSAGANTSCSYISNQKKRNNRLYTEWITDKRFLHFTNIFKEGSYFGMNFLFDELPHTLDPFDFEAFKKADVTFKVGTTHCITGKAIYFEPKKASRHSDMNQILRASSSLPLIAKTVEISGEHYLDGGIADPIPIEKSIEDGNQYHVVILTRNAGYQKTYSKTLHRLCKIYLRKYPHVIEKIRIRHEKYNDSLKKLYKLEKQGLVYIFRPQKPLLVDRFEKDSVRLKELYAQGYDETMESLPSFNQWLNTI
ncbi:MAG: patatin family protein [Clostridia bacterium]|jgi:predicted patatin/cPLA2 family phospholipase|nr:patatin family protein [Clostridia bacterium]